MVVMVVVVVSPLLLLRPLNTIFEKDLGWKLSIMDSIRFFGTDKSTCVCSNHKQKHST